MATGFFQRIRDWLSATPDTLPSTLRFLFIDDHTVGDIEVLPASTAQWCADEMKRIAAFAASHEAPGGAGWTDVYVRPKAPATVAALGIWFDDAAEALAQRLAEIEQVITGSLIAPQIIDRARAFGPSGLSAVVLYRDKDPRVVQTIELCLRGPAAEAAEVLFALATIPTPETLIVADWGTRRLARLDQPAEVARFANDS